MKILLADDDADMLDVTAYALRREGFNIIVATDGAQALRRWRSDEPDLVLLDVGMPRLNGFEVCQQIRETSQTPVIMLTAAGDEEHIVQGFIHGADDYVTKPFSPKQLAMRIRAILRRSTDARAPEPVREVVVGDLTLDLEAHRVCKGGEWVQLTPIEFRVLHILASNVGRVVSFARLADHVWGYDGGDPAVLKTHVSHVRSKLDLPREGLGAIRVVHGAGYYLSDR
ncbi:MAG TPA: response regulator transcription factor [Chloroflexota bacterium]|nr:response regulator transcription factor [Chloroflexota bacterium]